MPQHLIRLAFITSFIDNYFRALKLQILKVLAHNAKNHTFKKFLKFIKDQLIVCSVYLLLYIMQKNCYIILRIV